MSAINDGGPVHPGTEANGLNSEVNGWDVLPAQDKARAAIASARKQENPHD